MTSAKPTSANLEAALGKLIDLLNARRTQSRLPSDKATIDAFRFLFSSRVEKPRPLSRTEAYAANEVFQYLRSKDLVLNDAAEVSLDSQDIQNVLLALAAPAGKETLHSDHRALTAAVLDSLRQHSELNPLTAADGSDVELRNELFGAYVTVLARTGSSQEALSLLENAQDAARLQSSTIWINVLKGFVYEKQMSEFWNALSSMEGRFGPLDATSHEELCIFVAETTEPHPTDGALRLFESGLGTSSGVTISCLAAMLPLTAQTGRADLSTVISEQLRTRSGSGDEVGTLIQYYASLGGGIQDIKFRLNQLAENDPDIINMAAFNSLVKYAYQQRNPPLAQNYIALARSYGLRPDASTWLARLDFELARGDLDAAAEAFDALSLEDIPKDRSDVPILNRYVTALAYSENPNYEHLMRVLDSIIETRADVEPETVAVLCRVFLRRDDLEEISGLLRYRINTLPRADRARIGAVFEDFVLDPTIKDQHAYNAYDLLRHVLPETSVEHRIRLMQSFFDRNRPDQACLVFGHMRQRDNAEARPTADAYAKCFAGIAKCKDFDGLQMVFNMLKMDTYVDPTTKIHNSLMQAYTACRAPFTSIIDHFWKILESREGPTRNSFALALQACETWVPQGSQEARRIMALLQQWVIDIDKDIYDCYVGAIAGQSEFENVVEMIQHMKDDISEQPDAITLGTAYNAIPFQFRKDAFEKWAKEYYPDLWEELESMGDEVDEEWEIRYFRIDRTIDLDDDYPMFREGQYQPKLARDATLAIVEPQG